MISQTLHDPKLAISWPWTNLSCSWIS